MVIRILFSLLAMSFLWSCSQKPSSHLIVTRGFTFGANAGGVMIYLHNKTTKKVTAIHAVSNTHTVQLENGSYDFKAIGWDGSSPFNGNLLCGKTSADLSGSDATVDINVSQSGCNDDTFSSSANRSGGATNTLRIITCANFTTMPTVNSLCDATAKGNSGSYLIRMVPYDKIDETASAPQSNFGLTSNCIAAATSTASRTATGIKLPYGSSTTKLATVVEAFTDTTCSMGTTKRTFFFPDGLSNPASAPTAFFPNSTNSDLYLNHGGVKISDFYAYTPILTGASSLQTLTITNNSPNNISSVSATISTPFTITSNTCGTTLAAGASCTLNVNFVPTVAGSFSQNFTFAYNDGSAQSIVLPASGVANAPALLTFSGASGNFGTIPKSTGSMYQTYTLTNNGGVATTPTFTGVSAPFSYLDTCSTLAPGQSCTITMKVTPTVSPGNYSPALTATYNDGVNPSQTSIRGLNVVIAPELDIVISDQDYIFPSVNVGSLSTKTFTITNNNGLYSYNYTLQGFNSDFVYLGGTCGLTGTLPLSSSCTVTIRFRPTSAGLKTLFFNVAAIREFTASTQNFPNTISATGQSLAALTISDGPAVYDYGLVSDSNPVVKTFTVNNTGGSTANSLSLGGFSTNFANYTGGTCGTTLASGASCTYNIRFAPTAPGNQDDVIMLSYNNGSAETVAREIKARGIMSGTVNPFYSNGANWNDYVKDDGTDQFSATDTACTASSDPKCLHAGEMKKSVLPGVFSTCAGLTGQDSRGVFKWQCFYTGSVEFRTVGFNKGKGLRDLVDANNFWTIQFSVSDSTGLVYQTPLTTWWTNPVLNLFGTGGKTTSQALPIAISGAQGKSSSGGTSTGTLNNWELNTSGAIYTIPSNITVTSFHVGTQNIAIVTLPGATLSTNISMTNTCTTSGSNVSGSYPVVICAGTGGSNFLWFEVDIIGSTYTGAPAILLGPVNYSRIHNSKIHNGFDGLEIYSTTQPNLITDSEINSNSGLGFMTSNVGKLRIKNIVVRNNSSSYGLSITGSTGGGVIVEDSVFTGNISGIHLNTTSTLGTKILRSRAINNVNQGIYINGSQKNLISESLTAANGQNGIYLLGSGATSNTIISHISTNNTQDGISLSASPRNTFAQLSLLNNSQKNLNLVSSADYNTFFNVVTANPGAGTSINIVSSYNQFERVIAVNSSVKGLFVDNSTFVGTNNTFTDFYFGNNAVHCGSSGIMTSNLMNGTALGASTCTAQSTTFNLSDSFYGKATSDAVNLNGAALSTGNIAFASITDFIGFENNSRYWGPTDTGPFTTNTDGKCATGTCSLWNWMPKSAPTTTSLYNRSGSVTTENGEPWTGTGNCVDYAAGNIVHTDYMTTANTFQPNAIELVDGVGDDDGLCESNEKCMASPHLGAHQVGKVLGAPRASGICQTSGTISNASLSVWYQ